MAGELDGPHLSTLIEAGLGSAHLVFGTDPEAIYAPPLADAGAAAFGPGGPDPAVGALLTNDPPTVGLVYGAIQAGGRLVSLPLPGRSADPLAYGAFLQEACRAHGVTRVVARDDVATLLESIGVEALPHSALPGQVIAQANPRGFELVQFSSGSTASPKAIVLDDAVLGRNVVAMLGAVAPRPGDTTVSWLPLSHDLGLVGMLLTSTAAGAPRWVGEGTIVLLDPEQFLRRPRIWLDALDHWTGTFTAAPDFGFRLATKRPPSGLDLSLLRCAIVGAETVRADTLRSVVDTFGPAGLAPETLCPAYGMAELGLAASLTPPEVRWREEQVSTAALAEQRRRPPTADEPRTTLVASGLPLQGYGVRAAAEAGAIGPLDVLTPAAGWDPRRQRSFAGPDGVLPTGDLGYVDDDGWVYVCGRADDHIVAHGRNVYAPAIEAAVAALPGVRDGRVTAVDSPSGDWLVAFETTATDAPSSNDLIREVQRVSVAVAASRPTDILALPPGHLPMTPSGKVQRHEVRRRWMTGTLV